LCLAARLLSCRFSLVFGAAAGSRAEERESALRSAVGLFCNATADALCVGQWAPVCATAQLHSRAPIHSLWRGRRANRLAPIRSFVGHSIYWLQVATRGGSSLCLWPPENKTKLHVVAQPIGSVRARVWARCWQLAQTVLAKLPELATCELASLLSHLSRVVQ